MFRIVLDTNIIVSAIIRDGNPRKLFQRGIEGKYRILLSDEILDELFEVLQRPKFKMTVGEIIRIISALRQSGEKVHVTSNLQIVKRDPDDNIVINAAHDGNADYIVSGDKDIKDLKNFKGIKIVSAAEMLQMLDKN